MPNANGTHSLAAIVIAATLSACAVGPDFEQPAAPAVLAYDPSGLPQQTAGGEPDKSDAQKFTANADIPAQWWQVFHSEQLNKLIDRVLAANPDLQAAEGAWREAIANMRAQEGSFLPSFDGTGGATRSKSITNGVKPLTLYNASVNVSYVLDVFGGVRRGAEAMEAQADMQHFLHEATALSLTANVVTSAVREAFLREEIAATVNLAKAQRTQLDLMRKQFEIGSISKPDLLTQQQKLSQTEATLPALAKQLDQNRHLLATLAGQFPSEELGASFTLDSLTLPKDLPLSLPSQLVAQRPDIQAAAAQMHAATASVGVATANMLPQITLSGNSGILNYSGAALFGPGAAAWGLSGSISQPLFHGGELWHKREASEAVLDQAEAQYRSTVLSAFQNVADTLRALQSDAETFQSQAELERASAEQLQLAQIQYDAGAISLLVLLNAEQAHEQTKISLAQAKAARLSDTAALFQALGGGWWNRVTDDQDQTAPSENK